MNNIFDIFKQIESQKPAASGPIEWLIVGLGNPGKEYENTRHNAGFIAISLLAEKCGVKINKSKFKALIAEATISDKRVLLMMPQTYMNLSGEAVAEAATFYKIPPERILVFSDDISLDVAKTRVRRKGSHGGQKGLKSITEHLGSSDFPRVKLGVGQKPHPDYDLADWVLSNFTADERKRMNEAAEHAVDACRLIVAGKTDEAMNRFN
ncbi:MAG: aminoacyl-tRNA hydrolase [Clostridia bacterium]|nr:aminoacyl-tRNA hydrolase [Clostridia bacterium]